MVPVDPGMVAESPGGSQAEPAGRLVARPGKAGGIDEGLGQMDRMAVKRRPVPGKPTDRKSEGLRGEVLDALSGKDEKTAVVGHIRKPFALELLGPSDPFVAGGDLERGGGPSQKSHPFPVEKSHILDRLAGKPAESQRVVFPHQGIPALPLGRINRPDNERTEIPDRNREAGGVGSGGWLFQRIRYTKEKRKSQRKIQGERRTYARPVFRIGKMKSPCDAPGSRLDRSVQPIPRASRIARIGPGSCGIPAGSERKSGLGFR